MSKKRRIKWRSRGIGSSGKVYRIPGLVSHLYIMVVAERVGSAVHDLKLDVIQFDEVVFRLAQQGYSGNKDSGKDGTSKYRIMMILRMLSRP